MSKNRREIALWASAALLLAALPLLAARYPPVLDLPQLLAQIDLVGQALSAPEAPYEIRWWAPNKIAYPLLAGARLLGPAWAPRVALLEVAAVWIAAVFVLAFRRQRSPVQATLATVFLWSGTFYGGFLHFVLGIVALAFWLPELAVAKPERKPVSLALRTFAGGGLLYLTHALWFAAGLLALPLALALRRATAREWAARGLGMAPVVAAAAIWYPSLARDGWDTTVFWSRSPVARLVSPSAWTTTLLGGLRGPVEAVVLLLTASWLAAGLLTSRRTGARIDRALATAGALLLAAAFLLPEVVGPTALFGRRWGWVASVCLVLAVPTPAVRPALAKLFVGALVAAFSLATAVVWHDFDRNWSGGFEKLLAPLGKGERVLTLDFVRQVPGLWVPPLYHFGAYAQVERGVELAYSFAEVPSSLVVARELPVRHAWSPHLHKRPDLVTSDDLAAFDWVMVAANPETHAEFAHLFPKLLPEASAGPWTRYGWRLTP